MKFLMIDDCGEAFDLNLKSIVLQRHVFYQVCGCFIALLYDVIESVNIVTQQILENCQGSLIGTADTFCEFKP